MVDVKEETHDELFIPSTVKIQTGYNPQKVTILLALYYLAPGDHFGRLSQSLERRI